MPVRTHARSMSKLVTNIQGREIWVEERVRAAWEVCTW
jgi:hypothetical protein